MEENLKEYYQELLNDCITIADFCRKLNLVPTGGNYRRVKNIITKYELDTRHLLGSHWKKGKKVRGIPHIPIENYLVENSMYKNTVHLKKRLLKEGIKEPKCEVCGNTENLELHHINGNPSDNRLENLQILCPNCHAKTPNFRGKNKEVCRTHAPSQDWILTEEEVQLREETRKNNRRVRNKKSSIEQQEQTCQNCGKIFHSQRHQKYCSPECYYNDTKGNRPPILQLIKDFKELKSFVQVGQKYNVTDNAVRKWCKLYEIPEDSTGMKLFIQDFYTNFNQ